MPRVVTTPPHSRTLSPVGSIKIFIPLLYLSQMTSMRAASSTTFAGSYYALLSGTGVITGECRPLSIIICP
jgi:hypothetical protein